jgi:hypothetical protein
MLGFLSRPQHAEAGLRMGCAAGDTASSRMVAGMLQAAGLPGYGWVLPLWCTLGIGYRRVRCPGVCSDARPTPVTRPSLFATWQMGICVSGRAGADRELAMCAKHAGPRAGVAGLTALLSGGACQTAIAASSSQGGPVALWRGRVKKRPLRSLRPLPCSTQISMVCCRCRRS